MSAALIRGYGQGVGDIFDNCTIDANPEQTDADDDGYGNRCDGDFDQNCVVNALDLGYLKTVFFTSDALADLQGDDIVNAIDLGLFRDLFFGVPGPSSVGSACD